MRTRSFFFIGIFLWSMIIFTYSCSLQKPLVPPEAKPKAYKEASLQELIEMINKRAEAIETLTASLNIDFRPVTEENYRSCKGRLLLEKPNKIRLNGYRSLLPTFFLLVSNGYDYWLSIPSKKRAYLGKIQEVVISEDLSQEEIYFTPSHIIDSLLLHKIELNNLRKAFLDILPEMYIINIIEVNEEGDIYSRKRIWIDRKNFYIDQHDLFDPEGKLISNVYFREFKEVEGDIFPGLVFIKRPWEGVNIRLLFDNISFNTTINQEAFTFSPPEEHEIINLSKSETEQNSSVSN